MSRKLGLSVSLAAVFALAVYFVCAAIDVFPEMTDVNEVIAHCLDSPQRYMMNFALYHVPLLFFLKVPYLNPMYKTRIAPKSFEYVIFRALGTSVAVAVFVLLSYVIAALSMGRTLSDPLLLLSVCARMVSFSLFYHLLYLCLYWISSHEILGIAGVFLLNVVILTIYNSIKFQFRNVVPETLDKQFMIIYSLGGIVLCASVLLYAARRKEVLK